ncbi:MAG: hypothetical protein IKX57_06180 [Oscillospiraceae bacterium]|nr:hypothetical protein [Oscillospiraceae bacterium]
MGSYLMDSDGVFYVKGPRIIHDDRGHHKIFKRFQSEAEAEAYMEHMISQAYPPKPSGDLRQMNGKHRKSHRLKRPK